MTGYDRQNANTRWDIFVDSRHCFDSAELRWEATTIKCRVSILIRSVGYREISAFESGNAPLQGLLELDRTGMVLIDSIGLFYACDICPKRLDQKDGGKNLHAS